MKSEIEDKMEEMKDKLDTLTAAAEEKRNEGQSQEKHTKITEK